MANQGPNTNFSGSGNSYGSGPSTNAPTPYGGSNNIGSRSSTWKQDLTIGSGYGPRSGANAASGGGTGAREPNGSGSSTWRQDLSEDPRYAPAQTARQEDKSHSSTHAGSGRHSHHSHQDTRRESGGRSLLGELFRTERPKKEKKKTEGKKEKIIMVDD